MAEAMRIRFNEKVSELMVYKGKNNQLFTNDHYVSLIVKVKEAKRKTAQKTPEDYQRLARYDVVNNGSSEKLIVPVKNEGEPIIYYGCLEETFQIIHDCHLAIGHGGRVRMVKQLKTKYKNVTSELVTLYLNLCELCQRKKSLPKKGLVVKHILEKEFNSRCQTDLTQADEKLLRTKWKSLRDNFRQEIKKIPNHCISEDGTSTGYVPTWAHFPKLTFLTEQMTMRQPFLLTEHFSEVNENSPDNTQEVTIEEFKFIPEDQDQPTTVTNGKHQQKRKPTTAAITTSEKRRCNVASDSAEDNFSYFDENSSHEGNDDYHFFMSLLPYVRSLPRPKAMLLRMKIQEMVYNELFNTKTSSTLEEQQ